MRKKSKRLLCLILALMFVLTFLAACKDEPAAVSDTPTQSTTSSAPPSQAPASPTTSDSNTPAPPPPAAEPQTLVVGYSNFSQKFSPFFANTAYDVDVERMTNVILLDNDRVGNLIMKGIDGQTFTYNGVDYEYTGMANIDVVQKADGTVDYNIKLRDDIVFSDGVPMTIDDVIFSIYVVCDPTFDGSATFYSMPVTGMRNYRTGVTDEIYDKYESLADAMTAAGPDNTDFSAWTQEQQDTFWNKYVLPAGLAFTQEIVDYCVAAYSEHDTYGVWYRDQCLGSDVAFGMRMWGFGSANRIEVGEEEVIDADTGEPQVNEETGEPVMRKVYEYTGIFTGGETGTEFDLANGEFPTVEDYWNEIVTAYGYDFTDDGIEIETAGSSIWELIYNPYIYDQGLADPASSGEIMNIAGIKKTGDYSMTVTTDFFEVTNIYNFGFEIAPMHYYADKAQYDYSNNKFGFPKGDLSIIRTKTTTPMGAGPYKFVSYQNNVVSFEANPLYWKGEPKIKYVRFAEMSDSNKLSSLVAGNIDITDPSFNKTVAQDIRNYNSNKELAGDVITTNLVENLGYGYIGINADTVNVGGQPASKESKDLRTGLGTLFAVYRDTVINSYYGDAASAIQYPITNTSWAAPRPADDGYKRAYSVDVDGKNIYTDSMSEAQRYIAALDATIGYLKAAGFTFNDATGMFTAAPAGAALVYEVIIPADGEGNHPAYGILTAVKEALASIGITLEINDPVNSSVLWDTLEAGTQEMWCAAWQSTIDPDMYQVYHSSNVVGAGGTNSNHYGVRDAELDQLMLDARSTADQAFRKATYKRCLEIIMEWAVEIPNYQRKNVVIMSTDRVNLDTVTPDITTFWGWMHDLEKLEMN